MITYTETRPTLTLTDETKALLRRAQDPQDLNDALLATYVEYYAKAAVESLWPTLINGGEKRAAD